MHIYIYIYIDGQLRLSGNYQLLIKMTENNNKRRRGRRFLCFLEQCISNAVSGGESDQTCFAALLSLPVAKVQRVTTATVTAVQ